MSVFEITIQRKDEDAWPVVARHQPGAGALAQWTRGRLDLDLSELGLLLPSDKAYGQTLGEAMFRQELRDALVRAMAQAKSDDEPLRVLLIVEADDLRGLHWEQLCAPLDRGWDHLLLNQGTPFSLYLPSQIERRFPPIGRRDLRALVLVAGPETLEGDYGLAPFDVAATVGSVQQALGEISCDLLTSLGGSAGPPTLDALCDQLTTREHTLLHVVCHGAVLTDSGETILYFPRDEDQRPVPASELLKRLSRLDRLPHLTFLSTCESADPRAEAGLGGLGQRLVRELGMPAALAMTTRITIATAEALASAFYGHLRTHGEPDLALSQALAGLQGRHDVTVPALFSRLGERALWSDSLDRPLTDAEISYGLEELHGLLKQRAPILLPEFEDHAGRVRGTLGAEAAVLSTETRHERQAASAAINQLCSEAVDLSFNALALGHKPPAYDARCPFPGLLAFGARYLASGEEEQDDREFFFGREALTARLKEKLAEHNFLPVLGPSGSGKSSLVLAGLIPALQKEEPRLQMVYLTPGDHPLARWRVALDQARKEGRVQASEEGDRGGIWPPVVVVDQFEELFTLCTDEDERRAFLDGLLAHAEEARVILTMRADFWGECARYPGLRMAMQARQELIAAMDAPELRAAIEQQAQEVGLRFEADLSNTMLDAVMGEPGSMPLLQHALLELWKRRHGRWLMAKEYRDGIGGVQQAIAHTADALYMKLSPDEQKRMREVFLRLTRLGDEVLQGDERRDTRQRVRFEELVPSGSDPAPVRKLVQRLADARLVVTGLWATPEERKYLDDSRVQVEVAHEALIRHWPRLRTWLDEDRAGLRLREDVREAALDWKASNEDEAFLVHRGGRLEDAEALRRQPQFDLNELEQAYLEACIDLRERERKAKDEQQRRELDAARKLAAEQKARADDQEANAIRIRRRAVVIGAVGAVAITLAVLSSLFWRQAQTSAATATANLALAVTNEAQANLQKVIAVNNEATANVASTEAVGSAAAAETASARAIENAEEAQRQAKTARARELATQALVQVDERLDLRLLLSIEASQTEDLLQTRQALFETWSLEPQVTHFLQAHAHDVQSVAWSPDGRLASGGCADLDPFDALCSQGEIIVWDVQSGQPLHVLYGHQGRVETVAWSADGRLASGGCGEMGSYDGEPFCIKGGILVWDLSEAGPEGGQPALTLVGHEHSVTSVAWSADGRLASSAGDSTILVWDLSGASLESGRPAQILQGSPEGVASVAWSGDGRLASGSVDGSVNIWDLSEAAPQRNLPTQTLEGHAQRITSVAWSKDGRLAAGSFDGRVILWNVAQEGLETGLSPYILEAHPSGVQSVAWSEDGLLASGSWDATVKIWDFSRAGQEPSDPLHTLDARSFGVQSVAWSTEGRLASGSQGSTVILWDLERGRPARTLEGHTDGVTSMAWSGDGRLASGSVDNTVILWDLERGLPAWTLEGHSDEVTSVAWSEDGQLASGSLDGTVILWDLASASSGRIRPARTLAGYSDSVTSIAWSKDGRLASGSEDGTVVVWDLAKPSSEGTPPVFTLEEHSEEVTSVAWSADGRLASGSRDGSIVIVDLSEADLEGSLSGYILERDYHLVWSVAWSTDGRLAAGVDSMDGPEVLVWDLAQESPNARPPTHILRGHANRVQSVAWSEDGRLASGSWDMTAIVWDLERELADQTLKGYPSWVWSVAWSVDGRLAYGGCGDWESSGDQCGLTGIKIVPIAPKTVEQQACQRAGRNLSQKEWALYFPDEVYRKTCDQWPAGD